MPDSTKSQITLDFSASPTLAALVATKSAGDKVTLTVELTIQEVNDTTLTGSIDEVEVDGEAADNEDTAGDTTDESPAIIVMSKVDRKTPGARF